MSDTAAAGQPSEKVPDFIPGWFRRIGTDRKGEQIREAVRVLDAASFPISFLRHDEFASPTRPRSRGVSIGRRGSGMSLAVPPGYWIVRDGDGALRNWRHEDFHEQWVRESRPWLPSTELADAEAIDEGVMRKGIFDAGTELLEGAREEAKDVAEDLDERSLIEVELERGFNHLRNAAVSWMAL